MTFIFFGYLITMGLNYFLIGFLNSKYVFWVKFSHELAMVKKNSKKMYEIKRRNKYNNMHKIRECKK